MTLPAITDKRHKARSRLQSFYMGRAYPAILCIFTLAGYNDLFTMLGECNSSRWYSEYPKSLPTLLMAGADDPVGNYGEGVREVYDGLSKEGVVALDIALYEGARHELFNETNRAEIFRDMCDWLSSLCPQ